jgi:hypothetical protein
LIYIGRLRCRKNLEDEKASRRVPVLLERTMTVVVVDAGGGGGRRRRCIYRGFDPVVEASKLRSFLRILTAAT